MFRHDLVLPHQTIYAPEQEPNGYFIPVDNLYSSSNASLSWDLHWKQLASISGHAFCRISLVIKQIKGFSILHNQLYLELDCRVCSFPDSRGIILSSLTSVSISLGLTHHDIEHTSHHLKVEVIHLFFSCFVSWLAPLVRSVLTRVCIGGLHNTIHYIVYWILLLLDTHECIGLWFLQSADTFNICYLE